MVADEVSGDPRSLNAQRRLNAWLVEKTRCRNSAFAMVVDNYGHCCVQASELFRAPIYVEKLNSVPGSDATIFPYDFVAANFGTEPPY
ncbi:hypothetical protein D918_02927 [Trichuris suis]|nr:hypothetical protein D918_02927 [Trichuris suis]